MVVTGCYVFSLAISKDRVANAPDARRVRQTMLLFCNMSEKSAKAPESVYLERLERLG